jgi:hypothetical protein
MASCEFPPELGKVSGTLSKTTIRTSSGTITRRVVAQFRNGKQKIYIREDKPRRSKITKGELAARWSFAVMASEVTRRMAAGDKRPRKVIWAEVKAELQKGGNDAGQV